jgi:hypothetical protein
VHIALHSHDASVGIVRLFEREGWRCDRHFDGNSLVSRAFTVGDIGPICWQAPVCVCVCVCVCVVCACVYVCVCVCPCSCDTIVYVFVCRVMCRRKRTQADTIIGRLSFTDGVSTWTNPALDGA